MYYYSAVIRRCQYAQNRFPFLVNDFAYKLIDKMQNMWYYKYKEIYATSLMEEKLMKSKTKTVIIILASIAVLAGAVSLIIRLNTPTDADRLNDQIGAIEDLPIVTKDADDGEISINRGTASEDNTTAENEPLESITPAQTTSTRDESTTVPINDNADKPDSTTTTVTTTRKETTVYEPVVDDTPNGVKPAVTTGAATTTTQKPSDTTPPAEQKPADNGFPSNPSSGDEYIDDKGQTWIYNGIARRWIEGGHTNVETAPDFTPSGNVILS